MEAKTAANNQIMFELNIADLDEQLANTLNSSWAEIYKAIASYQDINDLRERTED
jgi:hypothetical protein